MTQSPDSPVEHDDRSIKKQTRWQQDLVWLVLLVVVLAAGAYFRWIGLNWDQNQHLHPDERFMTMVASSISIPETITEYFDTQTSSLNPNNRGYGFYVYGDLPLLLVRSFAELFDQTGYDQINLVGRVLSGVFDLLVVLLVFLTAQRLFNKIQLSLLAAAFYSAAVLPIQLSHYFTVDTFTNFFTFLAFYLAVIAATQNFAHQNPLSEKVRGWMNAEWKTVIPYALFGAAAGLALSSKVSAAPLVLLLPAAALIHFNRVPTETQDRDGMVLLRNLVVGGLFAVLFFRIFQPYAFSGPGFFGIGLNDKWLTTIGDLSAQSNGDVDFPPALQWARRPITFSLENLVVWGLGLPLGITAWAGFLWMGWRLLRERNWEKFALLWFWTGLYFAWQSLVFSRTMRYQLPVYAMLTIIAAWAVFEIWRRNGAKKDRFTLRQVFALTAGAAVILGTFGWAFAFSRIYTRPVTRVAASEWIYQNVPAAINVKIQSGDQIENHPLGFRSRVSVSAERPLVMAFQAQWTGSLDQVRIAHIVNALQDQVGAKTLIFLVTTDLEGRQVVGGGLLNGEFSAEGDPRGKSYSVRLDAPVSVAAGQTYYLRVIVNEPGQIVNLAGSILAGITTRDGALVQPLPDAVDALRQSADFITTFSPRTAGNITQVDLPHVVDWENQLTEKRLRLTISTEQGEYSSEVISPFIARADPRGEPVVIKFDSPISVQKGQIVSLRFSLGESSGVVGLYGSRQAIESSWDDSLPIGLAGYNPYDYDMGAYRGEMNFEMYWDDNAEKLDRFRNILNLSDLIFISSNRQWGTTTRIPERYPLTTAYYRALIGCPADKDLLWCYRVAKPGMFDSDLGFDLVQVFQSNPNLGPFEINTQFAEEAFTVYDHPKVLIFRKSDAFDPIKVEKLLASVDLTKVVHLTPKKAGEFQGDLKLPADRLTGQRLGGTWAELFDTNALINRSSAAAAVGWYLAVLLLGWVFYPLVRLGLSGLDDRGYAFSRLAGLLILSLVVWLAGSAGVPVTRGLIAGCLAVFVLINLLLFIPRKDEILADIRRINKQILLIEILFLLFFTAFLLVRLGNPDLWHPYKGGEKPMDFSYLNAVIKSTTYPPYDPWFAGGYINYYYYGFMLAGTLVKLLGIVPATAYNLILPTFFAFLGIGAFSLGWNLLSGSPGVGDDGIKNRPLVSGLITSAVLLLLGNQGTVRMIWSGFQRLVAPGNVEEAGFFQRWVWFLQGVPRFFTGATLPYSPGDWYWIPSRAIPNEPITEFPLFTFLYADPHAHLFALPLTAMALAWALSILRGKWQWGTESRYAVWKLLPTFFLGGVVIGALRPTNTWDFPTYLVIGAAAVLYTAGRYALDEGQSLWRRLLVGVVGTVGLVGLTFLLYQPFASWYGQGYNAVDWWQGDHTPVGSYLTHWGLFLFILVSWFTVETVDWMAKTPLSALNRLKNSAVYLWGLAGLLIISVGLLLYVGVKIGWIALPLALWAAILILRPGQSDFHRYALFLAGSALTLTLMVELIVLVGDIGRMNTVFKFYLQAWVMFAVASGAGLTSLLTQMERWDGGRLKTIWQVCLMLLFAGAFMFTLTATSDKIRDRMVREAPHTLDGMAYMSYAKYWDKDLEMDLSQDALAIEWMQKNVKGSPVIVEANTSEYRWGSRYTIYTGLPGVVGWNWHQRQQRAVLANEEVQQRVDQVGDFYQSTGRIEVEQFLDRYEVRYIVVGQLEKAYYDPAGLMKFEAWDGDLWREVYRDRDTAIYEVPDRGVQ